jgi:hypothetical protein
VVVVVVVCERVLAVVPHGIYFYYSQDPQPERTSRKVLVAGTMEMTHKYVKNGSFCLVFRRDFPVVDDHWKKSQA